MRNRTAAVLWRAGAGGAALGLVLLVLLPVALGTGADLSSYNGGWDGTSSFRDDVAGAPAWRLSPGGGDGQVRVRVAPLQEATLRSGDAVVLLGPTGPFPEDEIADLEGFLESGGWVVLADDFGSGDELLEGLDAGITIDARPVRDLAFDKRPAFVVTTDLADDPILGNASTVVLNHPAALRADANATVVARTGSTSWIDLDGDGTADPGEPRGPFPWAARAPVGDGQLVVLSDPGVLLNGMRDVADDGEVARALADRLRARPGTVWIDESHRDGAPDLLSAWSRTVGEAPALLHVASGVGVFAVALVATGAVPALGRGVRRVTDRVLAPSSAEDRDRRDVVERVLERHPDWDEDRLRAIVRGRDGRDGGEEE